MYRVGKRKAFKDSALRGSICCFTFLVAPVPVSRVPSPPNRSSLQKNGPQDAQIIMLEPKPLFNARFATHNFEVDHFTHLCSNFTVMHHIQEDSNIAEHVSIVKPREDSLQTSDNKVIPKPSSLNTSPFTLPFLLCMPIFSASVHSPSQPL
ncbi:uncharacterized protein LY89DRAFT_222764 [Mollisia scopiformis]|uniref:Uncharacterized protein n=1 Tax=Mollisia scopiformis TaxID=149040 RepID=A0A194WX22_MOLSC|nr:uncharacterized protein LY89DRAFT_222764 [Mollisia scopiformis]KUJ12132.1 hypothetical protein LY89DRAFT_222764 [Mollisia scopiformis]